MQGKHASKMSLGFAFALLLTLHLVSTQTSNPLNGKLSPLPFNGIPEEWKRENGLNLPEEELGVSSGSMTFSGDDDYQAGNQSDTAVTGQYDDKVNTTPLSQTTHNISNNPTIATAASIQQNNTSNPDTPNPYTEPSTTNGSHVNLAETDTTAPSPGNSTTTTTITTTTTASNNITTAAATANTTTTAATANTTNTAAAANTTTTAAAATANTTTTTTAAAGFNFTQTSTASGNFTTTSQPQLANYTKSPSENSTNTSVVTTTTVLNKTSVVLLNESSTASTTNINETGGSPAVRGNMDRGLSSDIQQQTKSQAWGAILGIGVAVAIVALVIYIIVKRRNYREFSHRKLVEDMPPEPVLRLDNSEPLDLKFDGFAYYNPGVQGDNIQMTSFPHGQTK